MANCLTCHGDSVSMLTGKPGTDPLLPLNEPAVIGDPNPPRLE